MELLHNFLFNLENLTPQKLNVGTDSSGGTVDITLNPNGTLTTGNTYIDSGKSATIAFTYPVL